MTCITKQTLTLLNKINAVDPMAAASYMLMLLDNKPKPLYFDEKPYDLSEAFLWRATKEDYDYWDDIHQRIINP